MMRLLPTTWSLMMLCWLSFVSCSHEPDRKITPSPATAQCTTDCTSVSNAFLKEHADLLDELIRTKAALEQERKRP